MLMEVWTQAETWGSQPSVLSDTRSAEWRAVYALSVAPPSLLERRLWTHTEPWIWALTLGTVSVPLCLRFRICNLCIFIYFLHCCRSREVKDIFLSAFLVFLPWWCTLPSREQWKHISSHSSEFHCSSLLCDGRVSNLNTDWIKGRDRKKQNTSGRSVLNNGILYLRFRRGLWQFVTMFIVTYVYMRRFYVHAYFLIPKLYNSGQSAILRISKNINFNND